MLGIRWYVRFTGPNQAFGDGAAESFFTVNDLNVGDEVTLYGKTFKITDADAFTKNFLTGLGIRVGNACETPANPHSQVLKSSRAKEGTAGRPYERFDSLRQFLDFDRKVLRYATSPSCWTISHAFT